MSLQRRTAVTPNSFMSVVFGFGFGFVVWLLVVLWFVFFFFSIPLINSTIFELIQSVPVNITIGVLCTLMQVHTYAAQRVKHIQLLI